jgi:hypothetical protein
MKDYCIYIVYKRYTNLVLNYKILHYPDNHNNY